ncbi:MAG: hypothetical protein M1133_14775 [Armatimonadetes bacterium]|nr:hypothetical protein [Armatimonadota bacterium]
MKLRRLCDLHRPTFEIMIHCGGTIGSIIPDLIAIGLGVLDSIHPMAAGVDPYYIKREFGKDLRLHGTVDVQGLLPFGKPQQIKDAVKRNDISRGFIGLTLGSSHGVQPEILVESIVALNEAADEMSSVHTSGQLI